MPPYDIYTILLYIFYGLCQCNCKKFSSFLKKSPAAPPKNWATSAEEEKYFHLFSVYENLSTSFGGLIDGIKNPHHQNAVLRACKHGTSLHGFDKGVDLVLESPHKIINISDYSTIVATLPEPTVLPPSRIAKFRPCSIAIG